MNYQKEKFKITPFTIASKRIEYLPRKKFNQRGERPVY